MEVGGQEDAHYLENPHQPGQSQHPDVAHEGGAVPASLDQRHQPHVQHARHDDHEVHPVPADHSGWAEEEVLLVQYRLQGELHHVEDEKGLVQPKEVLRIVRMGHLHEHGDDIHHDNGEADQREQVSVYKPQALRPGWSMEFCLGRSVRVLQLLQVRLGGVQLALCALQFGLCGLQSRAECVQQVLLLLRNVPQLLHLLPLDTHQGVVLVRVVHLLHRLVVHAVRLVGLGRAERTGVGARGSRIGHDQS
mmetsp:Transcript_68991/g.156363  ORF Transcript_68991/g.156363 Transcript_68991/m.156363 type:complete len:249 (-) Transcript_68991:43-789(-)